MALASETPGKAKRAQPTGTGGLGTFAGVFTPSILTILGIILFLRTGYVVGAAGLPRALLIILLANAISVLTSISLSAIATNLRVKAGGDYYVISRTLGVEYGGALGIVLFLAQSVSVAFYALGFGEAVATIAGAGKPWVAQVVAGAAVAALFVLAWLGADWATRFQYVVMAVLFAAIAAFFAGGIPGWDLDLARENLSATETPAGNLMPFWVIFALFFPAVTGFTQGVSMSGDLRDPVRSLPRGTFGAVGLSMLIYFAAAIVFAGAVAGPDLVADSGAMRRVSISAWLIDAGVIAATLSSALASFLGAPRILQSLAADRVFPILSVFSVGAGPSNNPRRGVLLSAAIAFGTIAVGSVDLIAPVVAMFFLISYGLLNYATYFEANANSPSFRPRFRFFNARASLVGSLVCLGAMLAIHPVAAAVGVALMFALHQYIAHTSKVERWADSSRSRRFQRVRDDLHAISADLEHARDWRPVLLAFSENPERRERILRFASWLEGRSGFTTAVQVIQGSGAAVRKLKQKTEEELRAEIARHKLPAFAKVVVAEEVEAAVPVLLQSHGLGRVCANTILLNWFDRRDKEGVPGLRSYSEYPRVGLRFGCNLVILAATEEDFDVVAATPPEKRRIDVWYRDNATGRMMLLLAFLMTRTEGWTDARIRLFVPVKAEVDPEQALADARQMLDEVRIDAKPEIVTEPDFDAIVERSASSTMVFLPIRIDEQGPCSVFGGSLNDLKEQLGVTALVLATQDLELDSEPEEGRHGEIAQAVDEADKVKKGAARAEKVVVRAEEKADGARQKLETARDEGALDETELQELSKADEEAAREAEQARRRATKSRAKAEQALKEAEDLLGRPLEEPEDPKKSE